MKVKLKSDRQGRDGILKKGSLITGPMAHRLIDLGYAEAFDAEARKYVRDRAAQFAANFADPVEPPAAEPAPAPSSPPAVDPPVEDQPAASGPAPAPAEAEEEAENNPDLDR